MNLPENTLHIWEVNDHAITDQGLLEQCLTVLSEEEGNRYHAIKSPDAQKQFLLTRAVVRFALSKYEPTITPEEWSFDIQEKGKPVLSQQHDSSIEFNVAHTPGKIIAAFYRNYCVGVDIESRTRNTDFLKLAKRFFSETEFNQVAELDGQPQKDRFLEIWTLKEAFLKCEGCGITVPLDSFSFNFVEDQAINLSIASDYIGQWDVSLFDIDDRYICAVASHKSDVTPDIHSFKAVPFTSVEPLEFSQRAQVHNIFSQ